MPSMTESEKIAHLLRRFGLGASESEMDYYATDGLKGAIDKLINYNSYDDNWTFKNEILANDKGILNMRAIQALFYSRVVTTNRPLQEKMTIFWHNHFATSAAKVDVPPVMDKHIQVLRENALGDFKTLLTAISQDQAMLYWLDNHENVKGKPNENFAREVMELFTLGIGNYSEKDIQEAARAFTGWTFGIQRGNRVVQAKKPAPRTTFVSNDDIHDDGMKSVLGKSGTFGGEDVIDVLCAQAQTARYITTKMWTWFAYSDPEPAVIERLARVFRNSNLSIKALVRAIMESPEFYSEKSEKGWIKSPIDFTVSAARSLGLGRLLHANLSNIQEGDIDGGRRAVGLAGMLMQSSKAMGMELLYPPDVSGWKPGPEWITSATMVERIKFADRVIGGGYQGLNNPNANKQQPGNQKNGNLFAVFIWNQIEQSPDPQVAANRLMNLFGAQSLKSKLPALTEAARVASGGKVTQGNCINVSRAVTRLIFGSPEYQFG